MLRQVTIDHFTSSACLKKYVSFSSLSGGCGWNSSLHQFSAAFTQRRSSCIYDSRGLGYWNEAFYAVRGDFSSLGVIHGLLSASNCAQSCSTTATCVAFQWTGSCTLLAGSFTDFCDLHQPGCVGAYGPTGFFFADLSNIYCSPSALDCACSREYYFCMRGAGCFSSESDLQDFANVCVSEGCSAAQCGLPQVFCNESNTCSADYLTCSTLNPVSSSSCTCIKSLTSCLSSAGCLTTDDVSNTSIAPESSLSSTVPLSLIQNWLANVFEPHIFIAYHVAVFAGVLIFNALQLTVGLVSRYVTFLHRLDPSLIIIIIIVVVISMY